MEGVDGAASAWVADGGNRVLSRELSAEAAEQHTGVALAAEIKELDSWKEFDVFESRRDREVSNQVARTRWVLTWKMADGQKSVKARLAAEGYQDPDFQEGIKGASGCVSLRPSHL